MGVLGLTCGPASVAAASAVNVPSWTWGRPTLIGPATDASGQVGFTSLSCPSLRLCVATERTGVNTSTVEVSSDPTDEHPIWRQTPLPYTLDHVTCPNDRLCLGLGGPALTNQMVVTTDPTGPTSAWRASPLPSGDDADVTGIACPSKALCVLAGLSNSGPLVLTSTSPATGRWTRTRLQSPPCTTSWCDPDPSLNGVTCPTSRLCLIPDLVGNLYVSTRPTGGTAAWSARSSNPPGYGGLSQLSCPSVSLCVATADRQLQVSTDPSGGGGTWRPAVAGFAVDWVACPLSDYCLGAPYEALPYATATPAAGTAAWQPTTIDPAGALLAVDCPSRVRCVAVDNAGDAVVGRGRIAPLRATPRPTIAGAARVGRLLNATTGHWSPDAPPRGYVYRWERCGRRCTRIRGAARSTYRVRRGDIRHRLRVRVTAFDAVGSTDAYSRMTTMVAGGGARR